MAKKKQNKSKSPIIPLAIIIAVVVIVAIIFGGDISIIIGNITDIDNPSIPSYTTSPTPSQTGDPSPSPSQSTPYEGDIGEFSIHFLTLGNKYAGDAIYIKAGDNDILIDAGSRGNSSDAIASYIDKYCTDGTLEYVIATHAHQDHIAAFVGTKAAPGIFERYECETIIDFPLTEATSSVYKNYVTKRDAEVESGAKHYTALECYNNQNGAQRVYNLGDGITMEILYNYYYENDTSNENNFSVCLLFTCGNNKFLLTGDLEAEGEKLLVENNDLSKVDVFKAAHHGSYTGSTDELLSVIDPEIVVVTCVAGSDEYTDNPDNMFPALAALRRIEKYTDKIFVTSVISDNDKGFEDLNGNIVITSDGNEVTVNCSNNNTVLNQTEWYKANRAA